MYDTSPNIRVKIISNIMSVYMIPLHKSQVLFGQLKTRSRHSHTYTGRRRMCAFMHAENYIELLKN